MKCLMCGIECLRTGNKQKFCLVCAVINKNIKEKERLKRPENVKKRAEYNQKQEVKARKKAWQESPAGKEYRKLWNENPVVKNRYQSEEYKLKRAEYNQKQEVKARKKAWHQSLEYKTKKSEYQKTQRYKDMQKIWRQKNSSYKEKQRLRYHTPERKEYLSKLYKNPKVMAKIKARYQQPAWIKKNKDRLKINNLKNIVQLREPYIKGLLNRNGLPTTQEVIEHKRLQILLKRGIKKLEEQLKQGG